MLVPPWVLLPISREVYESWEDQHQMEKKTSWSYKTKQEHGGGKEHMTNPGNEQYCVYKVSVFVSSKWWTEKKKKNKLHSRYGSEGGKENEEEGGRDWCVMPSQCCCSSN